MFELHERLQADTFEIGSLALSRLLLMNDASLPWLVLVPEREGVTEIHDLHEGERTILMEEIAKVSAVLQRLYMPDKINVGALGNIVSQLHVHVVGRYRTDRAWPGPIWGTGPARPYNESERAAFCERIKKAFEDMHEY